MKPINESVFISSVRAFFVTLFGALGIGAATLAIILSYVLIVAGIKEESLPSNVKVLADASGSRKKLSSSHPVILEISFDGEIGKDKLTGKNIEDLLLDTREDALKDRVKGILLVIDSPGGGVNDSDRIYRLLKKYREQYNIPIYAYVNGLCASGGYYISCAANKIYASNISLIGSIGVLSWPPFMNVTDTMKKIGVNALTLIAGTDKDQLNPFRDWKPDEQKHYQSLINFFYNDFVQVVSQNRSIPKEKIINELGAKVFPAPEAISLGLADVGESSRNETLTALVNAAGIKDKYQVVGYESESWWKKLVKEESDSPLLTGKIKHELSLPTHNGNPFSFIYRP